jgi:MFS family permease
MPHQKVLMEDFLDACRRHGRLELASNPCGQAAGMVEAYGGTKALALSATTAITGCIAAARIGGGWLADRVPAPLVMAGAHALALSADALLVLFPGPLLAVATLAVIGIGYGLVSGSVAAAIGIYWGSAQYGRLAGRLYVAWCVAAITLPVVAGRVFDLTGGYAAVIMIAAVGMAAVGIGAVCTGGWLTGVA